MRGRRNRTRTQAKKQDVWTHRSGLTPRRGAKNTHNNSQCTFRNISRWNRKEKQVNCVCTHDDTVANTALRSADSCWDDGLTVALHRVHESVVVPGSFHTYQHRSGCFISMLGAVQQPGSCSLTLHVLKELCQV